MILTGKAKEDFKKWLNKEMYYLGRHNFEDRDNNIEDLSDNFQNTLIIEWFDSVGICIDRDCINMEMVITDFSRGIKEEQTIIDCGVEEPFHNWWKKAIKKANEIYNNKN